MSRGIKRCLQVLEGTGALVCRRWAYMWGGVGGWCWWLVLLVVLVVALGAVVSLWCRVVVVLLVVLLGADFA